MHWQPSFGIVVGVLLLSWSGSLTAIDCNDVTGEVLSSANVECNNTHALRRPNFVIIYVDDLRHMLDADPHHEHAMPYLKHLADEKGINFENTACPRTVCSPSRIALFTGRRPGQTDTHYYYSKFDSKHKTFPGILHDQLGYSTYAFGKVIDSKSFERSFGSEKKKNYNDIDLCLHSRNSRQRGPDSCSFDEAFDNGRLRCMLAEPADQSTFTTFPDSDVCTYESWAAWRDQERAVSPDAPPPPFRSFRNAPNSVAQIENDNLLYVGGKRSDFTDAGVATAAINRIKERAVTGKPFLVVVGFWRPHLPLLASQEDFDFFDDASKGFDFTNTDYWTDTFSATLPNGLRPAADETRGYGTFFRMEDTTSPDGLRVVADMTKTATDPDKNHYVQVRKMYYATVRMVDSQIQRVVEALETFNEETRDNTHVIITSDHGFALGEYQRVGKWFLMESNTRVPLVLLPSRNLKKAFPSIKVPSVVRSPVDHTDIFPTVLDLAGLPDAKEPDSAIKNDAVPGVSLLPYLTRPDDSYTRSVAVTEYGNHGGTGLVFSLRSRFFKYIHFEKRSARYLFDYRGGSYYRMVERENVINNSNYADVRKAFEDIVDAALPGDRDPWATVKNKIPFDHNFPDVRGVNSPIT